MRKPILAAVAVLVLGLAAAFAAFLLGMRTKNPRVQGAVRRFNRAVVNPRQMQTAGQPGAEAAVVRHVGRRSGRPYANPVGAVPTGDGFVIALPYGTTADWVRNVLAAGGATIEHEGVAYRVEQPEVLDRAQVAEHFAQEQGLLDAFNVVDCLRVRIASVEGSDG